MVKSFNEYLEKMIEKVRQLVMRFWRQSSQWLSENRLLVVMIVVAFSWAVAASATLFPFYSINNDEAVYVLEAHTLLEGRLTLPVTDFDEFTQPRFVSLVGDKNIFMYTHVFPAFLAAGEFIFGSMRVSLGLIAAAAVGGIYALVHELYQDRTAALIASGMLLTSPLFLLHSATYLPYTFLLMMAVIFWYISAFGLRRGHQGALITAGVLAGLTFWARPLNGVIIILPVAAAVAFLPWSDFKAFAKNAGKILLGILPILGLVLIYNHYLTGNPLLFPQMAIDRYTIPDVGRDLFSLSSSSGPGSNPMVAENTQNLIRWFRTTFSSLQGWTFGGWLAWLPILYVLFTKYLNRQTLLLISFLWLHPLIFYLLGFMDMTPKLLEEFGPIYSIPVLVPLVVLIALGTISLFHKWRYATVLLVLGMITLNWISLKPKFSFHSEETQFYQAIYQPILEEEITNGLVFLPIIFDETILHPFGFLMNTPLIDGEVIYALDRGAENIQFIKEHPNRDIYEFSLIDIHQADDESANTRYLAQSFLTELQLEAGKSIREDLVVTNPTSHKFVFVTLRKNDQAEEYLIDEFSESGKAYQISWIYESGNLQIEMDQLPSNNQIENLPDESYFSLSVGFASSIDAEEIEIYQYRYLYQEDANGGLEVILPPEAYYLTDSALLRREDISEIINRVEIELD